MHTRSTTTNALAQSVSSRTHSPSSPISSISENLDTSVDTCSSCHPKPSHSKTLTRSRSSNAPTQDIPPCTTLSPKTSNGAKSSSSKKRHLKSPYLQDATTSKHDREIKVRELKRTALKIQSTGNAPASEHQRRVLLMVFEEITPYPDEAWLSQIAVIIHRCALYLRIADMILPLIPVILIREYSQVKNWFSNQRQKESRANRENTTSRSSPSDNLSSALRKALCDGRMLRLRPAALQYFKEEEWTDQLFEEIVMIHSFKVLMGLRREEDKVANSVIDVESS
jgi:hypothetical protein